jgi:hypothetical protein
MRFPFLSLRVASVLVAPLATMACYQSRQRADDAPPSSPLLEAVTCGLQADEALAASVRIGACSPASASPIMEAWEVGLISQLDGNSTQVNCEALRCAQRSLSCSDYLRCDGAQVEAVDCEPLRYVCDDDRLMRCDVGGDRARFVIDCRTFGGRCEGRACRNDAGCEWGPNSYGATRCDEGDLVVCDARLVCDSVVAGGSCGLVRVGGEATSASCGAGGREATYARQRCVGPVLVVTTLGASRTYEYDCVAGGYLRCDDERGCVEE